MHAFFDPFQLLLLYIIFLNYYHFELLSFSIIAFIFCCVFVLLKNRETQVKSIHQDETHIFVRYIFFTVLFL